MVSAFVDRPPVGDAGCVRGQVSQCDSAVRVVGVDHLERQIGVDVLIQGKFSLLHCMHQRSTRKSLADRPDVHDRVRRERDCAGPVGESVTLHPDDSLVNDDGCAKSRDSSLAHPLLDEAINIAIRAGAW